VTKLFSNSNDYNQEIEIYKLIANIDKDDKYFVKAVKGCYANSRNITKHLAKPVENCEMLKKYGNENLPQIILPFAGINLETYLKNSKINFDEWLPLAINLVEAISVLRTNNICHFDIKPANIMVHNNTARLTDFGLSTTFEKMYKYESKSNYDKVKNTLVVKFTGNPMYKDSVFPGYIIWPPEIHWHEYKSSNRIIKKYFEHSFTPISRFHPFDTKKDKDKIKIYVNEVNEDIENAVRTMYTLIKKYTDNDIRKIFNDNIEKIDLFSMGMTFIYSHPDINFGKFEELKGAYINIVRKMTAFDYTKRYSVTEALEALKALQKMI
jgi:serine/threonine protein kinase